MTLIESDSIWISLASLVILGFGVVFLSGVVTYYFACVRWGSNTVESEDIRGIGSIMAFFSGLVLFVYSVYVTVFSLIIGITYNTSIDLAVALPIVGISLIVGFFLVIAAGVVSNIK